MLDATVFYTFLYKRKSFEHERELRALIIRLEEDDNGNINQNVFGDGEYIPVDLQTLVENVCISPTSPQYFKDAINSLMERYGLDRQAKMSSLTEDPNY
jgi:hypothetical protein